MSHRLQVLLALCAVVQLVVGLRLEGTEEGSCDGVWFQPVPIGNWNVVESLKYLPGGSRHNLYNVASGHPRFPQMRENELVNNVCLMQNGSDSSGVGSAIGFGGRVLGTYTWQERKNQPGVFDTVQIGRGDDRRGPFGQGTQTVTLTDHATFLFLANCWILDGTQVKSWEVMSSTPKLSISTKRKIEQHALELGFNREKFMFLNYDGCDAGGGDGFPSAGREQYQRNNGWNRGKGLVGRGFFIPRHSRWTK